MKKPIIRNFWRKRSANNSWKQTADGKSEKNGELVASRAGGAIAGVASRTTGLMNKQCRMRSRSKSKKK